MIETGLWVLLTVSVYYLLAHAVACLTGSSSYTIAILLAWTLAISPIVSSIPSLGVLRVLIPVAALGRLGPSAVRETLSQGPLVPMSIATAVAVLAGWTLVLLAAGAWRDTHRDV